MIKKLTLSLLSAFTFCASVSAQNTVGTLYHDDAQSEDGYNLFMPFDQSSTYLIDPCGRIINEWPDSSVWRAGVSTHLLENGTLLKCKRNVTVAGAPIWAGGGGEIVEIRRWDNSLQWSFYMNDSLKRLHHEAIALPSGNIMMIGWEKKTKAEAIAAGRDTSMLPDGELWPDFLLEVIPIGSDSFDIRWEWHAWDHLIQDYDSTKANYGVIADHPELININLTGSTPKPADWMHSNGIDYNPETDLVMLSVPAWNEIYIIDHSTNTAQAASHSGGFSGIGGDLMWRWGQPANYGAPGSTQLGFQHNPHWMDLGLPPGHPDRNKIMVFNNRIGVTSSTVDILAPVFDTYEWEFVKDSTVGTWFPTLPEWSYKSVPATDFFSAQISNAQRLPNGNTLIFSGMQGWAFEINSMDSIVWEYVLPFKSGGIMTQGDAVTPGTNLAFRMNRYPVDFPGFAGFPMTPKAHIELNPDTSFCSWLPVYTDNGMVHGLSIYPNPANDVVVIEQQLPQFTTAEIFDAAGRLMRCITLNGTRTEVETSGLPEGFYFLVLDEKYAGKLVIQR